MTWNNLKNNAKKEGHALSLSQPEFFAFYGGVDTRRCSYCGLSEAAFTSLGIKNPHGYTTQCLGLDRSDSGAGYDKSNVRLACLICNRIKSNLFSAAEMDVIGRAICEVWKSRGLDAVR